MSDPTKVSRRLVAVFAADVEGYSRLMGADEVGTLEGLTERRAILDRFIADHRGRIANTGGDSVLAEFGSAVDAVECAVKAQDALAEANSALAPDRKISFRIGVHIGDVLIRAGDLFGDGVNIAARLQSIAKPGSVCISGATYDQVRKALPITFVDLGVQQVKNIQEPIRAYQVGAPTETREAAPVRFADAESPPPLPDKPSIAVLPFQNMSGDPEQQYFADGMVEEIITALSRFKWLFVIARNSSFTFTGRGIDVKEVGRRLGVRYVLEGSVRKAAGKVRITGQLIDAVTGAHIWADRFERDLTDVFVLQDELTFAVVSAVQPKLLQTEIEKATRRRPENLTAYDLYLRSRQKSYVRNREGLAETIQLAHRALDIDPSFTLAAAAAASAHLDNVSLGFATDPQFDRTEAARLVRLALSLDENDERVLATAGYLAAFLHGDYETAIDFADRAVACNPNEPRVWQQRANIYRYAGQYEEAIRSCERSIRLSPMDPWLHIALAVMGQTLIELHRFDEAVAVSKKALRQNPSDTTALRGLASALAHLGRDAEAREAAARLLEFDPAFTMSSWTARFNTSNLKLLNEGLRKAGLPE
jgi:adenylate cyclase